MNPSTAAAMLTPDRRRPRAVRATTPQANETPWLARLSRSLKNWRQRRAD